MILFDISDPVRPVRLSRIVNRAVVANGESHHSTVFSNDGTTLVLDAEHYVNACKGGTDSPVGALWFYDISDPRAPKERSSFQLPRPTDGHLCYGHESNIVPMLGPRDVLVTGWFGGGVDLVEFTDPAHPREIAYWASSAPAGEHSFSYAGYWYNGYVFSGNTALAWDEPMTHRGFDVYAVDDPIASEAITLTHMNAQTQEPLA